MTVSYRPLSYAAPNSSGKYVVAELCVDTVGDAHEYATGVSLERELAHTSTFTVSPHGATTSVVIHHSTG